MNKDQKIAEDINKLIISLHKSASQQFKENIKTYARKIIGSHIGRPITQTPMELRDKIINKITQKSDSKVVLQCQQISHKFLQAHSISKKSEILKMLIKLSDLSNHGNQNLSNLFKPVKKQVNISLGQTQQTINFSSVTLPKRSAYQEQLQMIRNRGSVDQGISQGALLKEISYVLQNISSNIIGLEHEQYILKNGINVNEPVRRIVSQLSDIGWLYSKINDSCKDQGSIRKALGLAIQEQMNQYYRWLAIIENMIKLEQLTLRKLILWSYEPFQKLQWLAIILQAVQSYQGCQMISIVNSYRPHGCTPINQLLNRIITHLLKPFFQYIYHWVYKGELMDNNYQFFIMQSTKVTQQYEWSRKYTLIEQKIPNILDKQSAYMILNAGKTIYFLKNHCKCNYQLQIPFIDTTNILATKMQQSSNILSIDFKKWLAQVALITNKQLTYVLLNRFDLKTHFQCMKNFFLMGKGDFIQHLYDNLKDQLMKPKTQLYQLTLDNFIAEAVSKCFGEQKKNNNKGKSIKHISHQSHVRISKNRAVERLLSQKIEWGNSGSDNWDTFNLKYSLLEIQALQALFTPQIMTSYQKIFNFLWRVKRIDQTLKDIWLLHIKQNPRNNQHNQLSNIFHFCYTLRNSMSHFLNNFYGYLMIAIQQVWNHFTINLKQANSFDYIIKLHQKMLKEILQITMNISKYKLINQSLNNIFKIILKFKINTNKLQNNFNQYQQQKKLYFNRKQLIKKGLSNIEINLPIFNQGYLIKQILEIKNIYQHTFKIFYQLVQKDNQNRLNILSFRLDFSQFFTEFYKEQHGYSYQ